MTAFELEVVWHDCECHGYGADLPLWHELADAEPGPVLDLGAGTGRVALALAAAGHAVVALDRSPAVLAALAQRAARAGVAERVRCVRADARDDTLDLGERFGLVLAPMQTVQLLGHDGRPAFWRALARWLAPEGLAALAIADPFDGVDARATEPPPPDVAEHDGWRFVSQPIAVSLDARAAAVTIERDRTVHAPSGGRSVQRDAIALDVLTAADLLAEAARAGLSGAGVRRIAATGEHVGSEVVLLRG